MSSARGYSSLMFLLLLVVVPLVLVPSGIPGFLFVVGMMLVLAVTSCVSVLLVILAAPADVEEELKGAGACLFLLLMILVPIVSLSSATPDFWSVLGACVAIVAASGGIALVVAAVRGVRWVMGRRSGSRRGGVAGFFGSRVSRTGRGKGPIE